jgi:hypothetical protein
MAIIRLIDEKVLEVRETGEEVADRIRGEGKVIRLTDLYDLDETSIWVNVTAITSFIEKSPPTGISGSFEVKIEEID